MDITGQGESEKFDRSSPVHTTLHTIRPAFSARILSLHPRSRGGGGERCRGEDLFPLSSFLSNLLDKYCSYRRDCLLKF